MILKSAETYHSFNRETLNPKTLNPKGPKPSLKRQVYIRPSLNKPPKPYVIMS